MLFDKNKYKNILDEISTNSLIDEKEHIKFLLGQISFSKEQEENISKRSKEFIDNIKSYKKFGIEKFMQEYSLEKEEGVAVMCLAETLLRIPDNKTASEFINDKISDKNWMQFFGLKNSSMVNFTSVGLALGGVFSSLSDIDNTLSKIIYKTGEATFLSIIKKAMEMLGKEFIMGNDIQQAIERSTKYAKDGFNVSFDILGESARSKDQAEFYYEEYIKSFHKIGKSDLITTDELLERPNISVKLTALHPRVELLKQKEVETELLPKLITLLKMAKENKIAVSFDAEEAKRLDIYLEIFAHIIYHPELSNYNGIGIVVQAYQKRAFKVIDFVQKLARDSGKTIPIRLVKGAYWDSEIKKAQELGLSDYHLFTRKEFTDLSYLACAKKIIENSDVLYPQFATHNAITAASIIEMAVDKKFEFQKLQGMGDGLHNQIIKNHKVRIYAPVGKFEDLLAYLMRRILENGANTSFVNQVYDKTISEEELLKLHHKKAEKLLENDLLIVKPENIYGDRKNSYGYDLGLKYQSNKLYEETKIFFGKDYQANSIIDGKEVKGDRGKDIFKPANKKEKIGHVTFVSKDHMLAALEIANSSYLDWEKFGVEKRAQILNKIADEFESNEFELYSLLIREAGKTISDAIAEVREAVDFCRYYAKNAVLIMQEKTMKGVTGEKNILSMHPRGVFLCISPWNFPLAIFTGQIVAALVCGNSVICKPAEQTCLIANFAVQLMHKAGIPTNVLHLIIGSGRVIGEALVSHPLIAGICFTGSTETARIINRTLAARNAPIVPLIAETGGQNAMIVDSSALLEQVVDDVITSAFMSAGQRCSALRCLYIQEEVYEPFIKLLKGALSEIQIGNTENFSNDIGPVIDDASKQNLEDHIKDMIKGKNFELIVHHNQKDELEEKSASFFVPHVIKINSINDIEDEKFGPILHIISYKSSDLDKVIHEINGYGFGLTFGVHSRIEEKYNYIREKMKIGNIYINRSMIGAQVESQAFGGEANSGTGFKAGGPHYLLKFLTERVTSINLTAIGANLDLIMNNTKS